MSKYEPVLEYIKSYWPKVTYTDKKIPEAGIRNRVMRLGRITLPYSFVAPNHRYFADTQFYWDSHFTILGLLESGQGKLAVNMVENLLFLQKKFGLIPARNSWTSIGRTQPPLLTSMAWEIYNRHLVDEGWMERVMLAAKAEYETVWHGKGRYMKELGLNRYQPRFWRSRLTEYESGWDRSSRFAGNKDNLIPVDLNSQLYKYETDFQKWAEVCGRTDDARYWLQRAASRQKAMHKYLWSKEHGFYMDYDLKTGQPHPFYSLAGFMPMWVYIATAEQGKACQQQLVKFEQKYGLTNTEKVTWRGFQWDYPNGWPPQQLLTYIALKNYGYQSDANRIAQKFIDLNAKLFQESGQLWEKYDVIAGTIGKSGRYPTEPGFSWTNAVFLSLLKYLENK